MGEQEPYAQIRPYPSKRYDAQYEAGEFMKQVKEDLYRRAEKRDKIKYY